MLDHSVKRLHCPVFVTFSTTVTMITKKHAIGHHLLTLHNRNSCKLVHNQSLVGSIQQEARPATVRDVIR